jgi:hypothetical protein
MANPKYADAGGFYIDVDWQPEEDGPVVRYTAYRDDSVELSRQLWQLAVNGEMGPIDPYTPPPVPVPVVISDRQFFQQLAVQGVITEQEALDAVTVGAIPASLAAVIDTLPQGQRFAAKMRVSGAVEFKRSNPLVATLGAAMGWTDEQIDDLWRQAAAL